MIEVRDLYKYYGQRKAIGPLSFSIAQGEIVGLLGLNGAGKTTALRVLACDLLPSSGRVLVDGIDVVDRPEDVRKRVGFLPDHPPLYSDMTVREYLMFAARLRGMSHAAAKQRIPQVASETQIDGVIDDAIASLSHGFRQRVGIAQAIVHRPRLLLLDEPILGLDPVQIVEMRQLLRGLRGDFTIVLSSHILSEISETCDRLLIIRQGEILASGTEEELSERLLRGVRVELTFQGDLEQAKAALGAVAGVRKIQPIGSSESGESVSAVLVEAESDVRQALVRALVNADIGVLAITRGERELESIFLRLAAQSSAEAS